MVTPSYCRDMQRYGGITRCLYLSGNQWKNFFVRIGCTWLGIVQNFALIAQRLVSKICGVAHSRVLNKAEPTNSFHDFTLLFAKILVQAIPWPSASTKGSGRKRIRRLYARCIKYPFFADLAILCQFSAVRLINQITGLRTMLYISPYPW